ncbi:hypothetical protein WH96_16520 [Kiloniella spongiae]|uniref:Uncharacterized protein n=1 Tax=Kiloniella spongiae TaxID=1489064 RepID=A0A0H2MAU4_9PROT|nr:DUF4447 family protein [Kiloniella spongiae]KLN59649.1 hypothetical protein WH96_16520 [Kiloniella spongiae]
MSKLTPDQMDDIIFGMGMTHREAAGVLRVPARDLFSWVQGKSEIPDEKATELLKLEETIEDYVEDLLATVDDIVEAKGKPESVPVIRYLGNKLFKEWKPEFYKIFRYHKVYSTVITRARIELHREEITLVPVTFDPESYQDFLGDKEDSEANRLAWAETVGTETVGTEKVGTKAVSAETVDAETVEPETVEADTEES